MKDIQYLKSELYTYIKKDEVIFDFLHQTSLDGLWFWNLENTDDEWMSENFWMTLGYSTKEASQKEQTWKALINPDDIAATTLHLNKHFEDANYTYEQLARYTHKKGNTIWMKCRGFAIRNNEGKPLRFLGTYINVTNEVHQTELLNLAHEVTKVGFWQVDLINNTNTWSAITKTIHEVPEDYMPNITTGINFYKEGDNRNKIIALVTQAISTGGEWDENLIIVTAKGNEKWVRARGAAEILNDKAIRLYGTFQDIDEEKRREIKLAQSEQQFKQTFEYAAIGMAIVGMQGTWIRVNKSLCNIIGYTEAELLQLTFQDITHPEDLESDLSLLNELIAGTRENYQMEKRYFHKNGTIVWVVLAVSMVKKQSGDPLHFVSQINDITKQKIAQQSVIENHEKLVGILNATEQVAIIGTTTNGLITTFNKGAENLLGYAANEIVYLQTPAIIHKPEEIIARGNELSTLLNKDVQGFDVFTEYAKHGQFENREWTYVRKDGSEFPVQLAVTAQRNDAGEISGYLGVATDITKLKNAETQLIEINQVMEAINRQLLQKNKELEQFAYVAAHDLQEPLRMISSFLSLIEQKYKHQLDDKGKQYIKYTIDGALRMRNIITDILDFSKAGIVNNIELHLNDMVARIITDFKSNTNYHAAEINMDNLPTICADETAMQQLFVNLIGNALKYQPAGNKPAIKISVNDMQDKWLFKIADNGIGIDEQYYEKVFAIFKRLHGKSDYSGTGIGLATCKKIITIYNGDIWIEPNQPVGSIFCFTLTK